MKNIAKSIYCSLIKKILITVITLFALFIVVSCGSSSMTNKTNDADLNNVTTLVE